MAKKVSLAEDDIAEELDEVSLAEEESAAEELSVEEPPVEEPPVEEPPAEVAAEEPKPRGANTTLTIVLCVLNVVAALGFTFLLVLDYQKRQDWSYAVFLNELFIQGLPLEQEDKGPSGSRVTLPRQKLASKEISDVFRLRGGKGGGEFWAVDEPLPNRVEPRRLTQQVLKDYFGTQGKPYVATLEEEIKRLKTQVPKDIAAAATAAAEAFKAKDDAAKRQFLNDLLFPLAQDIFQVEVLDAKLKSAKGLELDSYLEYAVQRRMLMDLLAPCEIFRPGDVRNLSIEQEVIAKAASDAPVTLKAKTDAAKREVIRKLLPLGFEAEALEQSQKYQAAKGPELDPYIEQAARRRLQEDILAPLELFWPGEGNTLVIDSLGALDKSKSEEVKKLLQSRLEVLERYLQKRFDVAIADKFDGAVHQGPQWDGTARLSWEKRQTIGFLLLAIATMQKPDPAKPGDFIPLYPDTPVPTAAPNLTRAQTILGLYEFAAAAQNLPLAWHALEDRLLQAIHVDREGFDVLFKDKPARNQAFIDKYAAEIKRIQDLTVEIRKANERLNDLREQDKAVKKIFEDRDEHLKAMTKKLLEARAETARQVAKLRELQDQLYRAQAVLRDATELNLRLEADIQAEEGKAKGFRGAKTP